MTSRFRSSSLGAVPHQKPLSRSRVESSAASPLEVRCACQFFQSDSLIPERINPIGSRPSSRVGVDNQPIFCSKHNIFEEETIEEENLQGSLLSFGKCSVPDYYADTNATFSIPAQKTINEYNHNYQFDKENQPPIHRPQAQFPSSSHGISIEDQQQLHHIPPIEIETFRADFPVINLNNDSTNINDNNSTQNTNLENRHNINNNNNFIIDNKPINVLRAQFSSQKSLDRYSTSTLLAKYRQKSHSVAPSLQGSAADIRMFPKMNNKMTVSFDYGKPSNSNTPSNVNPNFDQYHRMSPMFFPVRERLHKIERVSASR